MSWLRSLISLTSGGAGIGVYVVVFAVGLSIGGVSGWSVNGWRWQAAQADLVAEYMAAKDEAVREVEARRVKIAAAYARIDEERTRERSDARKEIARLRATVADGGERLRVAATCSAAAEMPRGTAAPGVGDGIAPELTADAREAYFSLREGIEQITSQVLACQDLLRQGVAHAQKN